MVLRVATGRLEEGDRRGSGPQKCFCRASPASLCHILACPFPGWAGAQVQGAGVTGHTWGWGSVQWSGCWGRSICFPSPVPASHPLAPIKPLLHSPAPPCPAPCCPCDLHSAPHHEWEKSLFPNRQFKHDCAGAGGEKVIVPGAWLLRRCGCPQVV